ncbi:MAG TPA: heme biosynthesis HemY N-terminal domain-containing protein [Ottowia sp.]|uniref:heme biosynthesis HemY N-terminal domain-containing protein n=1 Tax=Ottowia sp. TaxID=1898956 RepID=UPI002BFB7E7B|nr:heme biosynthesis HemY N-terminal domain-containing protein [Ottowia sp.]HMN21511.1 heme biosynthesis HemY N-terminal domain-containing protein [Ottowia sp.]
MRAALWLIGLFIAAVTLALFAGDNEGTVTVFWPPHRVDLSVNLALLLLAVLFAFWYAALRGLAALAELPRQARRWRAQQRERATQILMLDARVQLAAGRYLRARKAAEQVLARVPEQPGRAVGETSPSTLLALRTLAHLTAAESAHALQDEITRNQHLEGALANARAPGELREAVLLRAAQWALNERDPDAALARLAELPSGAQRRTAALRLKLKAARQAGRLGDAMDTARLLAKHGAFSPVGAASLLRALAAEQIARATDAEQLLQIWNGLDARERALPELALGAAEHGLALQLAPERVRDWLVPAWDQMQAVPDAWTESQRARLVRVLELAMATSTREASDQDWLGRIETAQQAAPRDALLQYLAGMSCVQRGLWGRAQLLLGQAVRTLDDEPLRRNAWCALARLAEQRGDDAAAAQAWREAAQA